MRQNLYDTHEKLYKRYGRQWRKRRMLDWRLFGSWNGWFFFVQNEKKGRLGKIWQLYKPKLRVNRLRVIRIRKVCESMRFDSGPEVFVPVNRNYVLTEYVLNENDCIFPLEIAAIRQRPDVVIFSQSLRVVILIELTVPLEDRIAAANTRKTDRYSSLLASENNGWHATHFPVEVRSRGWVLACLQKLGFSAISWRKNLRSDGSVVV